MTQLHFLTVLSLLISFHIASAFRFTFPATPDATLNFLELSPITITWETNTTDLATGRILLVNMAISPPSMTVIANRVELADKSYTVRREFALGLEGGGKYHFTFVPAGDGSSSVNSYDFTVEGGRDGGSGTSSSGGVSGSTSGSSPTMSISSTSQMSASTTSQTSTVATGTPSSTSAPNQSDSSSGGSSGRTWDRELGTVLALVVVAYLFN